VTQMPLVETESTMSTKSQPAGPMRRFSLLLRVAMLGKRGAGSEDGATAIEYAMIAAGVGAAVAATVYSLGTTTAGLYQSIASLL